MKKNKAFTLVELLAVIVILGVLLLIAVPTVTNLIDNYKKKAFIADCQAYIQAAKYSNSLFDQKQSQYFNIKNLDVENLKENHMGGVLFFDPDEDGKNEYYIYVYDKGLGFSLGTNVYEKVEFISEKDISISKLFEVSERFEKDIENNFEDDVTFISGSVNKVNFEFNMQEQDKDKQLIMMPSLELGERVYVPKKDKQGKFSCQVMTVLSNTTNQMVLFDSNSISISSFAAIRVNPDKEEDKKNQIELENEQYIKDYVDTIRLFSVNDLYYFANFDKYGFTSELFEENKDSIANLFSPLNPSSFYSTEWRNSYNNRFISLGDYSNEDRCMADGTIRKDDLGQCYMFDLSSVYKEGKPKVKSFDPYRDPIRYNYVVVVNNPNEYVGYNTVNQDAEASCKEKLVSLGI